ncbi:hypothetical protein M9H77_19884 [Catharanthus roseus]|uniref:Uncharacterized protein n=1 Tax=Catharanthus roseus TaxID=4058 RepID=A0ACC0BBL6_CATRO|nr:hypothetical protein M9H77_19884 [Catharanthus roseus]
MATATATLARQSPAILLCRRGSHFFRKNAVILPQTTRKCLPSAPAVFVTEKLRVATVPILRRRNFCVQATNEVSDSSSVDSILIKSMEKKIKEQLDADSVTVKDAYGDGRHVSIDVISSAFEGQSALNRQRMVYKAIWEELQNTVHAVDQMTTRTPSEASI